MHEYGFSRAFVYYMNFHTALLGPLRLTQHLRKAGPGHVTSARVAARRTADPDSAQRLSTANM